MKKKIIIIVTLVVVIALGGTLVYAAVGEDGNLVNPFTKILSDKVEDGTITQDEAGIFSKVWEAIKGDTKGADRDNIERMEKGKRPEVNIEFMEEYKEVMSAKIADVLDSLVESGILTAEDIEGAGDKALYLGAFMKDADDETVAAIKEAMNDIDDYMKAYFDEKVSDGTLTQEQVDIFLNMKKDMSKNPGGRMNDGSFYKRMPGKSNDSGETTAEPEA